MDSVIERGEKLDNLDVKTGNKVYIAFCFNLLKQDSPQGLPPATNTSQIPC